MSLFYSELNVEKWHARTISKIHIVPMGIILNTLKVSTAQSFKKSVNILLTDFLLTSTKTRQNPPKYRTKTDSPNNEINEAIEINKPKKFGYDIII